MTVELTSMTGVARLWSQKHSSCGQAERAYQTPLRRQRVRLVHVGRILQQNHGQLEDVCEMVVPLGHRRLVCAAACMRRGLEGDLRTHSGARSA